MGRLDAYPDEILLWVGGELTIYRISTKDGSLIYSQRFYEPAHPSWKSRNPSSVKMIDLNADGKPEVLINSLVYSDIELGSKIYAYTIPETPEAIQNGLFEDFLVADEITYDFQPQVIHPDGNTSKPAHILATSDRYSSFVLKQTGDATKFEYEKDAFAKTDYMGPLSTFDIDGDGWLEMLAANLIEGTIEFYKMSAPQMSKPVTYTEFLLNGILQ